MTWVTSGLGTSESPPKKTLIAFHLLIGWSSYSLIWYTRPFMCWLLFIFFFFQLYWGIYFTNMMVSYKSTLCFCCYFFGFGVFFGCSCDMDILEPWFEFIPHQPPKLLRWQCQIFNPQSHVGAHFIFSLLGPREPGRDRSGVLASFLCKSQMPALSIVISSKEIYSFSHLSIIQQ